MDLLQRSRRMAFALVAVVQLGPASVCAPAAAASAAARASAAAAAAATPTGSGEAAAVRAEAAPKGDAARSDAAAKAAFEALTEADRRALQEALIWTGDFASVVSGSYGPRTREAIAAYAKRMGLPPTGVLDAAARGKLLAAAEAQRQATGFAVFDDGHAGGLRIGLPRKLLAKTIATPSGSRYSAADGSIVVDTVSRPLGDNALSDVFDRMSAETEKRKVSYKLLRPDFFVVSGDIVNSAGDQKFYARFAAGTVDGVAAVQGFTLLYDKSLARTLDPISLAIAAAFQPFPAPGTPQAAAVPVVPPVRPPPPPVPAAPVLAGNAVLVAPGVALTRLSSAACGHPTVGGHAAQFKAQDAETGLALLDVPGAAGGPIALAAKAAAPGTRLFALFHAGTPAALVAASVETGSGPLVAAPFQEGPSGAALVDGSNALAGLAEADPKPPRLIAGIVLATGYRIIAAPAIATFLGHAGIATVPAGAAQARSLDLGDASSAWRGAVAPVFCAPRV